MRADVGAREAERQPQRRQSKMRRCMEPRGYTRYGVAEEIWEKVADMPPAQGIAVQAKIASGATWGGKVPVK